MTRAGGLRRAFNDIMSPDWPYGSPPSYFRRKCSWCETSIPHFTQPLEIGPNRVFVYLCRPCTRALIATGEEITH
jgi:hypothetical protein